MKTMLAFGAAAAFAALGVFHLVGPSGGEDGSSSKAGLPEGMLAAQTTRSRPAEAPLVSSVADLSSDAAGYRRLFREERLRAALGSDDPRVREQALQQRLRLWAHRDAANAARFALEITDAPQREQAIRIVAQIWGQEDAGAAVAWAAGLTDVTERRECLSSVCIGLASASPAKGVQLADEIGLHEGDVMENLVAQWVASDEGPALAWAYRRPASLERDRLMHRIAFAEAQTDPARAANLVVEQIPAGAARTEAVISVVNQWAQRDPAAALAWVADFPPGVLRDRALGELRGFTAGR